MNSNSYSLKTANWSCPSLEQGYTPNLITRNTFASWEDEEYVVKQVKMRRNQSPDRGVILPIWQNLESIALGRIVNEMTYPLPGEYLVEELDELEDMTCDLIHQPVIQANLEAIGLLRDQNEPVILEAEAPFSILAAMMDPMDLYLCFMEDDQRLKDILYRIACAESEYIKEALRAGCQMISLADPVGTMDLVGEKYYKEFCGNSEIQLMKMIDDSLDHAIVHLCKKMSQSLAIADFITVEDYDGLKELKMQEDGQTVNHISHLDLLKFMAEDSKIHFTGMTCMHNKRPDLNQSKVLHLK